MPVGFAVSRVFLLIGCIACQIRFFHAIILRLVVLQNIIVKRT